MRQLLKLFWGTSICLLGCSSQQERSGEEDVSVAAQRLITHGAFTQLDQPLGCTPDLSPCSSAPAGVYPGNIALLTDGRVLCSGAPTPGSGEKFASHEWWTLTPDSHGSYIHGTWAKVGDSPLGRTDNTSFIMKDGRYWECGGEYTEFGNDPVYRGRCDIFDPVSNSWTDLPNASAVISDSPASITADGSRIVVLPHYNSGFTHQFSFFGPTPPNPDDPTFTTFWSPLAGQNGGASSEAGSLLLADGSILFGDSKFERYFPSTNEWFNTVPTPGATTNEFSVGGEIGAFLMLYPKSPSEVARALILGGTVHNGLYSILEVTSILPPVVVPEAFNLAADSPTGYSGNHADTAAAVEPNGRVLSIMTDDLSGVGRTSFYEYSPDSDTWALATDETWSQTNFNSGAGNVRMLDLPNGQVFITGGRGVAWVYTPDTTITVSSSYAPTISSIAPVAYGSYVLHGVQLSGLTNGADYGDDAKLATNYPIVWLKNNSTNAIYFARTFNFSQMTPTRGLVGSCNFQLPADIPLGDYTVHLAASGLESTNTAQLSVTADRGLGLFALLD